MAFRLSAPLRHLQSCHRLAPLREHEFRWFWFAALCESTANWLLFAVQGWLLIQLTQRPQTVVLFFIVRLLPKVLLGLPAGAVSDRIGALPVLRAARFAGALPALLVGLGALSGSLSVDLLLISALLTSVIQAFDQPAQRTLIYSYAPGDLLVGGIALNGTATTLATLVAPLLLTLTAALGGVLWALPVQALLALASGAFLLRNHAPRRVPGSAVESMGRDCWAAVRYLASTPAIIALILLVGSPGMLDRLLTMVTPGYAQGHGGGAGMTLLFLAPATGALIGGSLLAWLGGEVRRLLPVALGSSSVAFVSVGLLATTRLFILSVVLFLILGAAKAAFSVAVMAALQRRVPEHARGRVLAL